MKITFFILLIVSHITYCQNGNKRITNHINKVDNLKITGNPVINLNGEVPTIDPDIVIIDPNTLAISSPKVIDSGNPDSLQFYTHFTVGNGGVATNIKITTSSFYIQHDSLGQIGHGTTIDLLNRLDRGQIVFFRIKAVLPKMSDTIYFYVKIFYNKYDPSKKDKIGTEELPFREMYCFVKEHYDRELPFLFKRKSFLIKALQVNNVW